MREPTRYENAAGVFRRFRGGGSPDGEADGLLRVSASRIAAAVEQVADMRIELKAAVAAGVIATKERLAAERERDTVLARLRAVAGGTAGRPDQFDEEE